MTLPWVSHCNIIQSRQDTERGRKCGIPLSHKLFCHLQTPGCVLWSMIPNTSHWLVPDVHCISLQIGTAEQREVSTQMASCRQVTFLMTILHVALPWSWWTPCSQNGCHTPIFRQCTDFFRLSTIKRDSVEGCYSFLCQACYLRGQQRNFKCSHAHGAPRCQDQVSCMNSLTNLSDLASCEMPRQCLTSE